MTTTAIPSEASPAGRIDFLDGIRGWASFIVLLHHSFACFLMMSTPPLLYTKERLVSDFSNLNFIDLVSGILVRFLTDGHLAVLVFFVLSGYALSVAHLNLAKRKLPLATASRYFRLMIPIFVTSFVAFLLMKLGLMFNLEVATTPERSSGWLGNFYKFNPDFVHFLNFSFVDVFFKYNGDATYNSNLWTMPIEIVGSFLIYAYLGIFRTTEKIHWHFVLPLTAAMYVVAPFYACFMIGYILAELNRQDAGNYSLKFPKIKKPEVTFVTMVVVTVILSSFYRDNDHGTCIFASSLVISVTYSKKLKSFFSNKTSHFLGHISFPLYLIQIPIICSWSSYLYLKLLSYGMEQVTANLLNLLVTVILCVLAAIALLPLEKFSIIASKKIGQKLIRQ